MIGHRQLASVFSEIVCDYIHYDNAELCNAAVPLLGGGNRQANPTQNMGVFFMSLEETDVIQSDGALYLVSGVK